MTKKLPPTQSACLVKMFCGLNLLLLCLSACSGPARRTATLLPSLPAATRTATATPSPSPTATPSPSRTPTSTPTPAAISPLTAADLAEVARFGNGVAEQVAWSPDGKTLAIATSLGIDLYDSASYAPAGFLDTALWSICLAYSPDSRLLAAGDADGSIQVWDTVQKLKLYDRETSDDRLSVLAFSPDGTRLLSGGQTGLARVWDAASGKLVDSFAGYTGGIQNLAISPDGELLLVATSESVQLRNLATREQLYSPVRTRVEAAYFSSDGQRIFTVGYSYEQGLDYQSKVSEWDTASGEFIAEHKTASDIIYALAVNPDQDLIITGGIEGISAWEATTNRNSKFLKFSGSVSALAFSPDGVQLAVIGRDIDRGDSSVKIWDYAAQKELQEFDQYTDNLTGAALSADGRWVAMVSADHKVQIWEAASQHLLQRFKGNLPITFNADGKIFVSGMGSGNKIMWEEYTNSTLELREVESGQIRPKGVPYCRGASAVAFSPDGKTIAFGGEQCRLTLRDIQSGEVIKTLDQAQNDEFSGGYAVTSLAFSPDGALLAAGSRSTIELWDVADQELVNVIAGLENDPRLAFSPDGRFLAASGFGGYMNPQVQIWDLFAHQPAFTLTVGSPVHGLAFSADSQLLAVGSQAGVKLWDAWSGKPIYELPLPDFDTAGLGFSADGQILMTAGANGSVRLWRVVSPEVIAGAPRLSPTHQLTATRRPTPTLRPTNTPTVTPIRLQVNKITTLGKGMVSSFTHSPDGKLIAGIVGQTLSWYDSATYEKLGTMKIENVWEQGDILFSPNSKLVVVENYIGASIVDLEIQAILGRAWGGNGDSFGYAFSKDSRYMAYVVGDRTTGGPYYYVGLFDTVEKQDISGNEWGEENLRFSTRLPFRYHTISAPAISPDSELLAAGHSDSRVYVWDLPTGETRFLLEGHAGKVYSVDFSPDGRYLASGSQDGTVRLWNPKTGLLSRVITGFTDDVRGVKFSADGRRLFVSVYDQPTQVWDMASGQLSLLERPQPTPDPFAVHLHRQGYLDSGWSTSVVFSPDGRSLAVSQGNTLVWDVTAITLTASLEWPQAGAAVGHAFSPDGKRLAAVSEDGDIQVWDARSGEVVLSLSSEMLVAGQVYYAAGGGNTGAGIGAGAVGEFGLAFSPDGDRLAFGNGPAIEVWDITAGEKLLSLEQNRPPAYATRVSYAADGQRLYAVLNRNQRAAVWNAETGALLSEVALPPVDPNAFTATDLSGPLLARNNYDDQGYWIELWNLDTAQMQRLVMPGREIEPLRFSPDGSLLAVVYDNQVYFWKTSAGQLVYILGDKINRGGLAISPDNSTLAVGTEGKAELWDIRAIAERAQLPAMTAVVLPPTPTPWSSKWPTATPYPTVIATPLPTVSLPDGAISPENASQVKELSRFGDGVIEQIAWGSYSDYVVAASSLGAYRYDIQLPGVTLSETARLERKGWTYSVAPLPSQRILTASVRGSQVQVRDMGTGEVLAEVTGSQPALSPDGRRLVYMGEDYDLHTWDIAAGQELAALHTYYGYAHDLTFSPDGRLVAAAQSSSYPQATYHNDAVRVWNARSGAIVNALSGPDNIITDLSFSQDGQYIIGAGGGSAWVWQVLPGAAPYTITLYHSVIDYNLNIYTQTVTAAALSPDNRILAVGDSDKNIWLYDRRSRGLLRQLEGHSSAIRRLRFSPNGAYLLSLDNDGALMIWNTASGKRLSTLYNHAGPIGGLAFRTDGLLAAWEGGTAWTILPSNGELLHTTHVYSGTILAASPAGDWLAVYYPYRMSLWDARTGEYAQTLEGQAEDAFVDYHWEGEVIRQFYGALFSPDGSRLAAYGTGGLWVYDTAGDRRVLYQTYGTYTRKATFSPDGLQIVICLFEQVRSPEIIDIPRGDSLWSLPDGGDMYASYAFSPDGRWVGALSNRWHYGYDEPESLELWDTSTRQLVKSVPFSQSSYLTSLAFSPGMRLAAVGQADGQIFLVDLTTFQLIASLPGHHGRVDYLAFSPDGRYLASGSADGTVRLWGVP